MLFNSIPFIYYFLPAVTFLYYVTPHAWRPSFLLAASLFFYSWWDPKLTPLLLASVSFNYWIGMRLVAAVQDGDQERAKRLAVTGVALNLAILGFFKYRFFAAETLGLITVAKTVVVPLAISFYTFQQISFLVDAWRGEVGRIPFLRYAAFVTFFPHLIAGPIFRHNELIPQFDRDESKNVLSNIAIGLSIFTFGLFKKVGIADVLSTYATPVFNTVRAGGGISTFDAWSGVLSYHLQIYFDFSGYSTMAIGLGKMLGIDLPLNFRSPYKSDSIIEFWRRWHITLSRFLRDYLYIPLGGNRLGSRRRYLNLLITMALGGLWHGAAWGFLLWGVLHGLFLAANHAWRHWVGERSMPYGVGVMLTTVAVVLAWVPFRAESLTATGSFYQAMLGGCSACAGFNAPVEVIPLLAIGFGLAWFMPTVEQIFGVDPAPVPRLRWQPSVAWSLAVAAGFIVCIASIVAVGKSSEFLYFQF